jgi:hypothetical protein
MPAVDAYYFEHNAGGPARRLFAIVPNDNLDLPYLTTAVYVGVKGDLSVIDSTSGAIIPFVAVPAGSILPIRVARVRATGTTAGALVGMG